MTTDAPLYSIVVCGLCLSNMVRLTDGSFHCAACKLHWTVESTARESGPVLPCRHCGQGVVSADTSTGWTHGPEDPPLWRNWQGARCPGRITGAEPVLAGEGT